MKIYVAALMLLALAPQRCAEGSTEVEYGQEESYIDDTAIERKNIASEWQVFMKEADSIVLAGRKRISYASDVMENSETSKFRMRGRIIKAEESLARLSNKVLMAKSFGTTENLYNTEKREAFKKELLALQLRLDEALNGLKN